LAKSVAVTVYYKAKTTFSLSFFVKAVALKQQISKLYPQIQRAVTSYHVYFSQRPVIIVKACFCA